MFHKLRKSSRGASEILATVMIISIVVAASAIVAVVLTNVDVVDLFGYLGSPEPKEVKITLDIVVINDTDYDSLSDTIILLLSLDVDSPTIYIQDIDIQLPTGQTIDDIEPWFITETSQLWNHEFVGYTVPYGHINASFTIQINNLGRNEGELNSGLSFYITFYYTYVSDLGGKLLTISSNTKSPLLTAP